jgi:hypothetical protein
MANYGSFAGGLADGLRNGMDIARAFDVAEDRKIARADAEKRKKVDQEIAAQLLGGAAQKNAPAGLEPVQAAQSVPNGSAVGDTWGLQPVAVGAPAAMDTARAPDASAVGLADSAPGAFGGTGLRQPVAPAMAGSAEKKSPQPADYLGGGEFGQIADGLTRAYRKALELGEPGRAMQLLADREKFVGQHREQAFNAAQSRYQLTGDPNSYVPFVNRFMPGGIEVTAINKRAEQAGGAPVYDFVGVDTATGKPVQQPISEFMLQNFVRSVSDPKAQQAMVAQQAKLLWEAEQKRRDKLLDSQLRSDEELRKPRVLGKDQTLYMPDGKGGMRVGAQGSEAGKPKTVTSDKDFASYIMRLNGVESMEGLGEDQRQRVGEIIAIGENINRLNAGTSAGKVLSQANLAALSQQVRAGLGTFEPIQLANGTTGFTVRHEGTRVRVPLSLVPNKVQQMVAARLEGREAVPGSSAAAALGPANADSPEPKPASVTTGNTGRAAPTAQPATESAEGAQLDAARTQLRQAQGRVRELRTKPPGLKAGEQARARHAELLMQAERDVELAKTAERAAADRWARATQGSEITRAAMGRPNVEGTNEQL